jgi:hypothetical protein
MWVVLGLLSLAGFAAWMAYVRWDVNWSGTPSGPGRVKRATNKGRLVGLRVGLETPSELDFELKRETWIDGLAKSIGLAQEPQVGSDNFDAQFYVICDDTRLTALLRQDRELMQRVRERAGRSAQGFDFRRLVCRRGQLWVDLKPHATVDEAAEVAHSLQELQALSAALPALPAYKQRTLDRRFLHAAIVLGVAGGLAINAVLQMLRVVLSHFPFAVDAGRLWTLSLPLAAGIVVVLVFATLLLLGRSARVHLVLGQVLLLGSFGAVGTAFTEVRDYNMEADRGPPVDLPATVLEKRFSRGSKSTSYYLIFSDWNGGGGSRQLQVSRSDYNLYPMGVAVTVRQWPGALRVRWVEKIAPR